MINLMMRLGLALTGSNLDLATLPEEEGQGGAGQSGEQDEQDEQDGQDGQQDGDGQDGDQEGEGAEGEGAEGDQEGDEEGQSGQSGGEPSDQDGDQDGDNGEADGEDHSDPDGGQNEGGQNGDDTVDGPTNDAGGFDGGDEESSMLDSLLDAMENGAESGLKDNNSALGEAINEEGDVEANEQAWRPFTADHDKVRIPSVGDKERRKADRLKKAVKAQISFLRAKLRSKFLQANKVETRHGVRRGKGLSSRLLVNTALESKATGRARRPDWDRRQVESTSLAVSVVLDQSGSMCGSEHIAAMAGIAIAEPLVSLGSPCQVIGPRDGSWYGGYYEDHTGCHRSGSVDIDIFKDWDEKLSDTLPRFAKVTATGGTPLSDGIQFALKELTNRSERHRVVMVVTDGMPNCPNVVRRQIRLAAEAGVYVIGIGIGWGADGVRGLFPVHVAVPNMAELPQEMINVLDSLMFPKRGKRIALDGAA